MPGKRRVRIDTGVPIPGLVEEEVDGAPRPGVIRPWDWDGRIPGGEPQVTTILGTSASCSRGRPRINVGIRHRRCNKRGGK